MNSDLQTVLALAIVAVAALWLVHRAFAKRNHPGCGSDCGAVSPEVRRLKSRLKR